MPIVPVKWEIVPLKGRYCRDCVESLTRYRVRRGSVIAMCPEDLHQFLHNGDMEIVEQITEGNHESQ